MDDSSHRVLLEKALSSAIEQAPKLPTQPIIHVETVRDLKVQKSATIIIDWASKDVSAVISTIDSAPLFASDKTYLLFGLTGGLGRSLVEWMAQKGARYIALTSRKPDIDPKWLQQLESDGAVITI